MAAMWVLLLADNLDVLMVELLVRWMVAWTV